MINDHAGLGTIWLFDVAHLGIIYRDLCRTARLRMPGGNFSCFCHRFIGGITPVTDKDDMGTMDFLCMEPHVALKCRF